ncbi:MAG: 1,4-alpha-glucan branching protein GlgB [Rhodothermales bacterium]|nr:1,4-alpha-glucan branching protein GlgB [Rhodothermales bacterium]
MPFLKKSDVEKWYAGSHDGAYDRLGAHPNKRGTWFCVWAPHATSVSVVGDFNDWNEKSGMLKHANRGEGGFWEAYIRSAKPGQHYKYRIRRGKYLVDKTDPFAFAMEAPAHGGNPVVGMSAIISELDYQWTDDDWMATRTGPEELDQPMSIYEVHLGSWRKRDDGYSMTFREIAEPLAKHVKKLGFTHVELLPVMEHPYYGSWGYQVVGYFATTYRYGTPADLQYLINYLHREGIGVLLDWVPAHFATDSQGLVFFDGSTLYEYTDPLMRTHPDWGTYVFDYGKGGVQSFLVSNAVFWLDKFHIDGLRVDAVASMLYRDYSRDEWRPNQYGGRDNLEAIETLKKVNDIVYSRFESVHMIAEESTAWPKVTRPTYEGGLGFLHKWNMGWMHDTLRYMSQDPVNRKHHNNDLTFPLWYAFSEHFILPLSHDEVVHGKGSLWNKMPGDAWQKSANLRLLLAHQFGHPGKKLLFMGGEFGQIREWNADGELDWHLYDDVLHAGIAALVSELNSLYTTRPSLQKDTGESFEWVLFEDHGESIASYVRRSGDEQLLFVFNFTPVPRPGYELNCPAGEWSLLLSSDNSTYGGSGTSVPQTVVCEEQNDDERFAGVFDLPPLGMVIYERNAS